MIEYVRDVVFISVNALIAVTVPVLISWYIKWRKGSDNRAVCAHLHAIGSANRGQLVGSVGGLDRLRIEAALVRLCASGMVDRESGGMPVFKIAEGAEVLIDE